jgi:hypothetical protein
MLRARGNAAIEMRGGRGFLRRLGLRLALLALAVQVAIPLLLAVELRAAVAQSAADAVIAHSLCLHDGAPPPDGTPHGDCSLAFCPLCAALAAAATLGTPAQDQPSVPAAPRAVPFRFDPSRRLAAAAFPHPYQSRAPPVA